MLLCRRDVQVVVDGDVVLRRCWFGVLLWCCFVVMMCCCVVGVLFCGVGVVLLCCVCRCDVVL